MGCVCYGFLHFFFFFFKQKTAYEMRISDWSSDVCSSDLVPGRRGRRGAVAVLAPHPPTHAEHSEERVGDHVGVALLGQQPRSEERRVGKECVSTCRSRWSPYH